MGLALAGALGVSSQLGCAVSSSRQAFRHSLPRLSARAPSQGRRAVLADGGGQPSDAGGSLAVGHLCEGGTK